MELDFAGYPGNLRALIEHAPIADDHDARGLADLVERDSFRGQLGADAGGVADRKGNDGLFQIDLLREAPSAEARS